MSFDHRLQRCAGVAALAFLAAGPGCRADRQPGASTQAEVPAAGAAGSQAETREAQAIAREPRLQLTDSASVVELPAAMGKALAAHAPGVVPWRRNEYAPEVLAHLEEAPTEVLFGVVGDFNGDGARDVALQGYTDRHELFLVLLAAGDSARVIELERRDLYFRPRGLKRDIYLRPVRPGETVEVSSEVSERPPAIEHDAFMQVFEGQAAMLYYWNGERFVTFVVGD